jgi:3-oxoacyl-[acyl-carrier-protein] synthase II
VTGRQGVWITGVGTVNPLGRTHAETADNLLAGRSGVRRLTQFDPGGHLCQIAGTLDELPVPAGWRTDEFSRLDRVDRAALWCATVALRDAGLWGQRDRPIGVALGQGAEWIRQWEVDAQQGGRSVYNSAEDPEPLLSRLRRRLQLTGPAATVAAACASGNLALAQARRWIECGWVDVCLAGACDLSITPMSLAGFGNLRALSRRNHEPARASRPFDRQRDGFVMGEGGALFVLESAAHARRRGARAYGEVAGCGASSDACHMVIPSSDSVPAARAVRQALRDAAVNPAEIDYVNAHATSTPIGDRAEALMLREVFGERVRTVPVSATKSMTGHLLGAASAVQAIACLAALERQALPPTINLDDPDPDCALCHVANGAQTRRVRVVLSNAFGFGGSNVCVLFRRAA